MSKPLDRAYIFGLVITIELEDDVFFVLVDHPYRDDLIIHSKSLRERPARRKFAEAVAELEAQFESQGRRWDR